MSRAEVAAFLREFVEELEGEGETVATGVEQGDRRSEESGRRTDTGTAGQSGTGTGTGTGTTTGTGAGSDADRRRRSGEERAEPPAGDARRVTFVVGGDSATVTIPETVEFDVEVESRSPLLQSGESQAVEFQLSWEIEERHEDDSIDLK